MKTLTALLTAAVLALVLSASHLIDDGGDGDGESTAAEATQSPLPEPDIVLQAQTGHGDASNMVSAIKTMTEKLSQITSGAI